MISERQLSEYFPSFWKHHFPLLDTAYVKRFNAQKKKRLLGVDGLTILPVPLSENVERFDLVSELAFEFAQESYRSSQYGGADREAAQARAESTIARLKRETDITPSSPTEIAEADALVKVYNEFFRNIAEGTPLQFRPRIRGAGILNLMEADFVSATTLYEVKAVNRNLQYGDLHQILCYLFCGLGSKEYSWANYCIFNPRQAVQYSGSVSELLGYLSGRTADECIYNILDALMEREQPLEASF